MKYLFVDQILELDPRNTTVGLKTIAEDEFYLTAGSIDKKKYFMPALIGEALGQLTALNVMHEMDFKMRPVAGVVSGAQMHRAVYAGETLTMRSQIDYLDNEVVEYHGSVYVEDEEVFTLQKALGPLLPMHDFIDPSNVKEQFESLINNNVKKTHQSSCDLNVLDTGFDTIVDFNPNQSIAVQKHIPSDAPFFIEHFPLKPVLPMTMLLEFKRNLGNLFFQKSEFTDDFVMLEFKKVKMTDFILPESVITYGLNLRKIVNDIAQVSFITTVNDKRVCIAEALFSKREAS